jgi:uncharacterized SAM-binding protein YcdF (DUF218 family)
MPMRADDPYLVPGTTRSVDDTPVGMIRPLEAGARQSRPADARPRRRRGVRRAVRAALLLGLAVVGYFAISLYQVWTTGRSDHAGNVDAIVVMGAAQYDGRPSPQLAARLDHAAELWPQGRAPLVVVTGGNRPGDRFTEAEASAGYLAERGVPAESVLLEGAGTNSYESLRGVADLLAARGLDEVLIVTDPYHALRSKLIAEQVGLTAHVSPTPTSVVTGAEQATRELQEAAGVALGRLIGFQHI